MKKIISYIAHFSLLCTVSMYAMIITERDIAVFQTAISDNPKIKDRLLIEPVLIKIIQDLKRSTPNAPINGKLDAFLPKTMHEDRFDLPFVKDPTTIPDAAIIKRLKETQHYWYQFCEKPDVISEHIMNKTIKTAVEENRKRAPYFQLFKKVIEAPNIQEKDKHYAQLLTEMGFLAKK